MTTRRRTIRGIDADHQHSHRVVTRVSVLAFNVIAFVLLRALGTGLNVFGGPVHVRQTVVASVVAAVLFALLLAMRSLYVAGAIVIWSAAFAIWNAAALQHWVSSAYSLIIGACGATCLWHLRLMQQYRKEYAAAWSPYEIQPGDVFTVRDGNAFAVVKVLATDPGRVHVRQFTLRYPERPWLVKSSTLLREPVGALGSYAHLPLDFDEFLRWEPSLLRSEPVDEAELQPLEVWRRQVAQ